MAQNKKLFIAWTAVGAFNILLYAFFLFILFMWEWDDSIFIYLFPAVSAIFLAVLWQVTFKKYRSKFLYCGLFAAAEIAAFEHLALLYWYDFMYIGFGHVSPAMAAVIILSFFLPTAFLTLSVIMFKKTLKSFNSAAESENVKNF